MALAALIVLLTCGAFVVVRVQDAHDNRTLNHRLADFRTAVGSDPPAPPGAVLVSRREFTGDLASDGPAIEWTYKYSGTPDAFVDHYRRTLTSAGWTETGNGNLDGQLANFVQDRTRVLLSLFRKGTTPEFSVLATP